MSQFHMSPWYAQPYAFGTVIHAANGQRIAEVFHDEADQAVSDATARLVKMAPTLLLSLKLACSILTDHHQHMDLVHHIQKQIDVVEPKALAAASKSA